MMCTTKEFLREKKAKCCLAFLPNNVQFEFEKSDVPIEVRES